MNGGAWETLAALKLEVFFWEPDRKAARGKLLYRSFNP
jgi:hypothetical protein